MNIYLIYMNSDMTEGRGPMMLVHIMADRQAAVDYAMKQPGVFGRKDAQRLTNKSWQLAPYWDYNNPTIVGTQIVAGDWEVYEADVNEKSCSYH